MTVQTLTIPRLVPAERLRAPQANIPQTPELRERLRLQARAYVEANRPVPPLSLDELHAHADRLLATHKHDPIYRDFAAVVLNSELWRDQLACVPFGRRLLLLPKCLRVEDRCPAPIDEIGLLCKKCGLCSIQELQGEAERLGYAVLCAEGSAVVTKLIQTGKIDAIIGVSCLSVLEQAFPYMESAGIPGIAIPLLQGDCKNTSVDMDWVWDAIHLTSDDRTWRLDLDDLRGQVAGWFELESLERLAGPAASPSERIAREYLARHGKRWRPFLLACVYVALAQDPTAPLPEELKKLAVAVECFHKASLVHDDIEDDDELRYGEKTVHAEHGVPVALNVGDLLLGEGYRLIAQCGADADTVARMLNVAAGGHRTLCLGQGAELWWGRDPVPLSTLEVLDIFRKKTSPAFEVALGLGAAFAGAYSSVSDVLARYCEALGIAYQIRDDLEDLAAGHGSDDLSRLRPSLPLAVALEQAEGEDRRLLELAWRRGPVDARPLRDIIRRTGAEERCHGLLDSYRQQAVRSLAELENASLKGLLRRVVSKVFGIEIKGWCGEFEARNAPGGPTGAEAAG